MDTDFKRVRARLTLVFDWRWPEPPEWALSILTRDVPSLLRELGASANPMPTYMNFTPLMLAVHQGRGPVVRALIQAGHPVEREESVSEQPLTMALQRIDLGQGGAAKALLEGGATVRWQDMASALLWSSSGNRAQALLAKHGVDWEDPERLLDVLKVVTHFAPLLNTNGLWRFSPDDLERFVAVRDFPPEVWERAFMEVHQRVVWMRSFPDQNPRELSYLLVLANRWRKSCGADWNNRKLYGALGDFWARRHHESGVTGRVSSSEHMHDVAWMKKSIQFLQEHLGPWASPAPGEPDAFVSLLDRAPEFGSLFLGDDFMHLALDSFERCEAAYRALCASFAQAPLQTAAWSRLAQAARWTTVESIAVDTLFPMALSNRMRMLNLWVELGWRDSASSWALPVQSRLVDASLSDNPMELPLAWVDALQQVGVPVQAMLEGVWRLPSFQARTLQPWVGVPTWAGPLVCHLLQRGAALSPAQKALVEDWAQGSDVRNMFARNVQLDQTWTTVEQASARPRF